MTESKGHKDETGIEVEPEPSFTDDLQTQD